MIRFVIMRAKEAFLVIALLLNYYFWIGQRPLDLLSFELLFLPIQSLHVKRKDVVVMLQVHDDPVDALLFPGRAARLLRKSELRRTA